MGILGSVLGIVVLLVIAVLFSNNRKAINLRTVLGALAIQIGFAALILYVPYGRDALQATANGVSNVIAYGNEGINFVFGGLADPSNVGFIFAVKVLPIIVFFSGLISVLYYLGIMQVVIKVIGGALQAALGTSKAESMSAAANIFVGQTEAPLVVRPYIKNMTQSELYGGLYSFYRGLSNGGLCRNGRAVDLLNCGIFHGCTSRFIICENFIPTN